MASIVIANFNGASVLPGTLAAISRLQPPPEEVILVDDGSTDDGVDVARRAFPALKVIALGKNTRRPNRVRNVGIKAAVSRYVLVTDNDVAFEPDALGILEESLRTLPNAAICTPRLYHADDPGRIYIDGPRYHFIGQTVQSHRNELRPRERGVVDGRWCGGVAMIDRERCGEVGFFDEDYYFGWGEDVQLYHRVTLLGYKCYHILHAVGLHWGKDRTTERAFAQVRNRWVLMLEYYQYSSFIKLAPALAVFEVAQFVGLAAKGIPGTYFRAALNVLIRLPRILYKRRKIQRTRVVRDRDIFVSGHIYLSPKLLKGRVVKAGFYGMNRFFDAYWGLVRNSL